jgi:hypothetical protein
MPMDEKTEENYHFVQSPEFVVNLASFIKKVAPETFDEFIRFLESEEKNPKTSPEIKREFEKVLSNINQLVQNAV